MMMPTHPTAGFVFIEAAFAFAALKVLLDGPATSTHFGKFFSGMCGAHWNVGT